jgi:predicted metal-dependent hydrolase
VAYRHGQRLPLDGSAAEGPVLRLSVNPRARRISVRIDGRSGEAVVTAPSERRLGDALAFAKSRAGWIRQRIEARPVDRPFAPGATILFEGRPARLVAVGGAGAARLAEGGAGLEIRSGGEGDAFARRVLNLLKREARTRLVARTEVHRAALGQAPVRVSIVDTRSRWGSCSPHNRSIRYSWRVVMAPPAVLDYLAAHEVAHLVRPDHSPAYWTVVERLIGDHRPHRKWLRDHGAALQAAG